MNYLIIIPGFGSPYIEHKIDLFKHNIKTICNNNKNNYDITIYNYDRIAYNLDQYKEISTNIRNITENLTKGVIGEFIYKYVTPDIVNNYDYIIILVDDIQICEDFSIERCIKNYTEYNMDILSPALAPDSPKYSYKYMIREKNNRKIRRVNMIEYFLYIMSKDAYAKYYNLLDINTTWLWGIDLAAGKLLNSYITDYYTVKHFYSNRSSYKSVPHARREFDANKKKFDLLNYEYTVLNYLDWI